MAGTQFNLAAGQRAERKLLITVAEWSEGSTKVREILDVSAVSIPANNQTSITARKQIVEDEMNEKLKRERQRKKLEISLKIGGLK